MKILSKKVMDVLMAAMMLSTMLISMQVNASVVTKSLTTDITLQGKQMSLILLFPCPADGLA